MFAHMLARETGWGANVDGMLDTIDPIAFTEAIAADQIAPLGMERLRQMIAVGFSDLLRVQGCDTTPEMYTGDEPAEPSIQSDAEQIAIARQIAAMQNGGL